MRKQNPKEYNIAIGDIGISFIFDQRVFNDRFEYYADEFVADDNKAEIKLDIHRSNIPKDSNREKLFDSKTNWSLYRHNGKYILRDCCFDSSNPPEKLIILEPDFKSGDIYLTNQAFYQSPSFNLAKYTLIQILMVILLSRGRGVMLHACGVNDSGNGYLFVGRSGQGKSTMAKLWSGNRVCVLSDDRIIVRKIKQRFWIYGTPWHGESKICSPEKVPLKKIFFLRHAKVNRVKEVDPFDAVSRLICCSFPTFWDKQGMEFTLKFFSDLVKNIPIYELEFLPDKSALDFIKNH